MDNYGHLLEKGTAPEIPSIDVDHPTRPKKYRCGDCGRFVWPFRLADFRNVPPVLKGGSDADFVCDGCLTTYERSHGAIPRPQPENPGPKPFQARRLMQGLDWRAKQRVWRDLVKAAQKGTRDAEN